jgi:hypothetical protein
MVIDELREFGVSAPALEAIAVERAAAPDPVLRQAPRTVALTKEPKQEQPQPIVAAARTAASAPPGVYLDRRGTSLLPKTPRRERRKRTDRRRSNTFGTPFPDRRLTRSAYEQVFLKLVSGGRLRVGGELYTPVGMKGWYHAIFRNASGEERLLTIDQLLRKMNDWT